MVQEELIRRAIDHLRDLLDQSGKVLYSSVSTLRPGKLYILGLNPGGDPLHPESYTVRESLKRLPEKSTNDYLDEAWTHGHGSYPAGRHPLQRRVQWLVESLGYDLREVCASNLIFTRSPAAAGADYPVRAHTCWAVHAAILNIVQPDSVIAFGNSGRSPFQFLLQLAREENPTYDVQVETAASGHGAWKCKSFRAPIGGVERTVIGFPHLSRYSPAGRAGVSEWLRERVLG